MAPFCLPKSTKILQKSDPKSHQNFDRFLLRFFLDFGSVWGTKLEPCWPPFSSQDAPRRPQDGHKTAQHAPETPKDAPRRPETPPRRPPGAQNPPQTTILEGFWGDFGRFWEDFSKSFWEDFAVQHASSNLLLKKTCLHKFAFQKSQSKK